MREITPTPLLIGLRAARANLIPGLLIQALMVCLVIAYYYHAPTHSALEVLAAVKARYGYLASVLISLIAGAILPELFQIGVFQRGRIRAMNLSNLAFTIPFWALNGLILDLFYQWQSVWFGSEPTLPTVIKKVLVDQFLYNPFFAAPYQMWCYEWKRQNYSTAGLSRVFAPSFYKARIIPVLIATWGVWIPICTVVYSLPLLLQIPLVGLAMSFWVLMYTFIVTHKAGSEEIPPTTDSLRT